MKMHADHYAALVAVVAPLDTATNRSAYRAGQFPRADAVKDRDKRYRWDLMWAARGMDAMGGTTEVYAYMSDAHIDTALRAIVPALDTDTEGDR